MTAPDENNAVSANPSTLAPKRSRLWIFLPLLTIILLAIGWTAAWYYAAARAEQEITAWIAREAEQGRSWNCADRQLAGFPFRFELICNQPSLEIAGPTPWKWSAARAHAVAQVWNPGHIIAEFQGPATLSEASTGRNLTANWSLLQMSGVGNAGTPERLSVVTSDYVLTEGETTLFFSKHTEFHSRHHPGDSGNALDLALNVIGAGSGAMGGPATGGVNAELETTITQLPPLQAMPLADRLALWQQAGGKLAISLAKITAGGGALTATGEIGLDASRRPDGNLTLNVANAQGLLTGLGTAGLMPEQVSSLAPLLMAAGLPTTIDGQRASAFPFVFRSGRVALGVIPLGKIGPLF